MEKHIIYINKEAKTYEYYISEETKYGCNASVPPIVKTRKEVTRQEFLELAYKRGIELLVMEEMEDPYLALFELTGLKRKIYKLRAPEPFEDL